MPTNRQIEEEFIRAYDELSDSIFKHVFFRLSDRERAKEIMQEVFTKTWEYICVGHVVENLKAFLYRAANNMIIDQYRKKKEYSLDALEEDGYEPSIDAYEMVGKEVSIEYVVHFLDKLTPLYREVVHLRFVDGFTPREIGERLKLTENVVSVRIHRGLKKLKTILLASREYADHKTA